MINFLLGVRSYPIVVELDRYGMSQTVRMLGTKVPPFVDQAAPAIRAGTGDP
jgi:hypothetical protein